jgi:hypothetical protein
MGFDPYNYLLKVQDSIKTPTPKVGAHLGVWGFIPSHSPTLLGTWNVTPKLHSSPASFASPYFGHKPKIRVATHNVMLTSFFNHPSKFNMSLYEDFSWFFKNIDIHHPLWLFILDRLGLWHMAQSKLITWHINWILETNIYLHLGRLVHSHR